MEKLAGYQYAFDNSFLMATTDQKGVITHINDTFCKVTKYSSDELIGKNYNVLISNIQPKPVTRIRETIAQFGKWRGEIKIVAKDGSISWLDTNIFQFENQIDKSYSYSIVCSDITFKKESYDQLKIAYLKAIEDARILELKNTQLIDLCSILSHNLRAPLINISMLVDYAEQSQDEIERNEVLAKVKPVVNYLMDDLNELVESIQVSQDIDIKVDKIVLKDALEKVLQRFGAQIDQFKADIQYNFEQAPVIYFPQNYIDSILSNLISNALKYKSPDRNPVIKIETINKENNRIVLAVNDNGLGINLDIHKDNVFKIRKTFHKHPDARGFGLYMTKNQVEAMNGKIWIESKPGEGSTFFIEFKSQIDDSDKINNSH